MSKFCLVFAKVFLIWAFSFVLVTPAFATHQCGNGTCSHGETTANCCSDCGCASALESCIANSCIAPTSTPAAPTPTATPDPGQPASTPTPTQSSSSGSSAGSSSSTSVTYYPSVALAVFSPNPTNKASLTLLGTASIEQGTIALVEYTLTDGRIWIQAQSADGDFNGKDEHFRFTVSNLAEGTYTIKARAKSGAGVFTQDGSYASQTVTIATTPPQVTLDKITPNPTKNQTPVLTGKVSAKFADITRVEVSIDDRKSWQVAKRLGNTFSIALTKLEDGNYTVHARAFDSAGNSGLSDMQVLIIDTIPPIIGGGMQALGPQILIPDKNGMVSVVAGTDTTIAMSMKGGVTEVQVHTASDSFPLSAKTGTNIWIGKIKFESGGAKTLAISAVDGAGNSTERKFHTLNVEDSGKVADKKTKRSIENATVTLYFYETVSRQWIVWEAESYGQKNPQKTGKNGNYSFMVPSGKYYLEIKAAGYNSLESEIIQVSQTSIINYLLTPTPKPKVEFTLPFFGKVVLSFPTFSPPETFSVSKALAQKQLTGENLNFQAGVPAPALSLPNLVNKEISIPSFKGKKLLLSFIAPWSPLSLEQAPILSEVSKDLKKDQAVLVVSLQESIATTQTLMKKGNYMFSVVADKDGNTAADYNVTILPHHVFIDSEGKIRETFTGVLTKEEMQKKFDDVQ